MDVLPLATDSITAKNGNRLLLRFQAWTYQLMVWGLVHFWQFWLHPLNIIQHEAFFDAFALAFHWIAYFGFFVPRIGFAQSVLLHLASSSFEATLLFTNFALSHTPLPLLQYHHREHWIERSLRRTLDIHSHSKAIGPVLGPIMDNIVDYLMGYLNYQVAHHLWPLMPHYRESDPKVQKAIQELADEVPELDLHYNVTTYWGAMYDMYSNLSAIAHDHGANDFDTMHPIAPKWVKGGDFPKEVAA